jgi:hypothetical protein
VDYRIVDKHNPPLPKWALLDWGPLQSARGVLSYFDRFSNGASSGAPSFSYHRQSRELSRVRARYHVDAVAGTGTDLEKSVNVSRWLCDAVAPGGAEGVANNSLALLDHALGGRKGGCSGLNCAQFTVVFTELMLSLGLYSRAVVLRGFNPYQGGDHCVPIVWIREQRRWAMIDPLYHAYYGDREGKCLSPWDLRRGLAHHAFIRVNPDWGSRTHPWRWNENTLLLFYAKNLFSMGSPLRTGFGSCERGVVPMAWLVPRGFDPVYRELKLDRYHAMRNDGTVRLEVSNAEYRMARERWSAAGHAISSIKRFAAAPA